MWSACLSPPPSHPIPAASPRHGRWIPRIYKRSLWIQQRLRWEQSWTWLADYVRSVWGTFSFMYASQHVQFFKFILWICSSSFQTDFWGESQRHGAATHTSLTHWLTLYEAAIQFTVIVHTPKCVVVGVLAPCAAALNIHVFPAFLKFNIKSNFSLLFKKINRNNELVQRSPIMFEFSMKFFFFDIANSCYPPPKWHLVGFVTSQSKLKGVGNHDLTTVWPVGHKPTVYVGQRANVKKLFMYLFDKMLHKNNKLGVLKLYIFQ